jgi:uncharacterized protein (DUF983 family)
VAGPIAIASALARLVEITCPRCGRVKLFERTRRKTLLRTCPRCKQTLPMMPPDSER